MTFSILSIFAERRKWGGGICAANDGGVSTLALTPLRLVLRTIHLPICGIRQKWRGPKVLCLPRRLNHNPALDYPVNVLKLADIGQWITVKRDEIGVAAHCDGPDFAFPS